MEFSYRESRAILSGVIEMLGGELTPYLSVLRRAVETGGYQVPEASLSVPTDDYVERAVEAMVDQVYTKSLRYVFVIAIGGSNLGTKAIYEAMAGARDLAPHTHPRLLFIDTLSSSLLLTAKALIKKAESADELLFIVISKSGTTVETIANAEILLTAFAERFGRNAKRVVVLSETGSPLLQAATEQQMHVIDLPPLVGGRYSVFTPVGLLPLALVGFSPQSMREPAALMVQKSLHPDIALNPAALSALAQYYFYRSGIRQHDTFVFGPTLESMGKWYRQLLGESIGKATSGPTGQKIGITPTVTVGSTDLHSVGQLYVGGPNDRLTTFVDIKNQVSLPVPEPRVWPEVAKAVTGESTSSIMTAIEFATKDVYNAHQLPFLSVTLSDLSPGAISSFLQFKMCEVMMLGYLLKVNPFDQPQVEAYKLATKRRLEKPNS